MEKSDKIVILGDIHGRTCWKDIIAKENPDHIIFLGDYVDSHEDITRKQQLDNFVEILEYKESNPDKVTLLVGNHDLSEMFYGFKCSGHSSSFMYDLQKYVERFKAYAKIVCIYDNIIFSHAGVTKTWLNEISKVENVNKINELPINSHHLAFQDRYYFTDPYGDDVYQSPVWIRIPSLIEDAVEGYSQVFGHTPVERIINLREKYLENENEDIKHDFYMCDALPNEYLIYENGEFRSAKLNNK